MNYIDQKWSNVGNLTCICNETLGKLIEPHIQPLFTTPINTTMIQSHHYLQPWIIAISSYLVSLLPTCHTYQSVPNIVVRVILSIPKPEHIFSLLKTFHSFLFLQIKAQILTTTHIPLHLLGLQLPLLLVTFLTQSCITLALIQFAPGTLNSLLFLGHTRHAFAGGPLHLFFPQPGMLFLPVFAYFLQVRIWKLPCQPSFPRLPYLKYQHANSFFLSYFSQASNTF